jgi:DNA recombination protein RmuC
MDGTSLLVALAALAVGALIGWLIATRQSGALTAERDGVTERFKTAIVDLESESRSRQAAELRLATVEAERSAREAALGEQIA